MSFSNNWEELSLENVKLRLHSLTFSDAKMNKLIKEKPYFLDHEKIAAVGRLSVNGEYDLVDKILLISKPTPAVLDQLRKNASRKLELQRKLEIGKK